MSSTEMMAPALVSGRRCKICDRKLSPTNADDFCKRHSGEEITAYNARSGIKKSTKEVSASARMFPEPVYDGPRPRSVEVVIVAVCKACEVQKSDIMQSLKGWHRMASEVQAKRLVIYLLHQDLGLNGQEIAAVLGLVSNVAQGLKKAKEEIRLKESFQEKARLARSYYEAEASA